MSVECVYVGSGSGGNIAEMTLNFADRRLIGANQVASYVVLGPDGHESTVTNAIDGNYATHTGLGNTVGESERLRITLGFTLSPTCPDFLAECNDNLAAAMLLIDDLEGQLSDADALIGELQAEIDDLTERLEQWEPDDPKLRRLILNLMEHFASGRR